MSLAASDVRPLCPTCEERLIHAKGECRSCRAYRVRTGRQRPAEVILANFDTRSRGVTRGAPGVVTCIRRESEAILGQSPNHPLWPELCAACGSVTVWPEGRPIPLCAAHLANLALLAAIFDESDELRRVLEVVTA